MAYERCTLCAVGTCHICKRPHQASLSHRLNGALPYAHDVLQGRHVAGVDHAGIHRLVGVAPRLIHPEPVQPVPQAVRVVRTHGIGPGHLRGGHRFNFCSRRGSISLNFLRFFGLGRHNTAFLVVAVHVDFEFILPGKGFLAEITGKGTLPRVGSNMSVEVGDAGKLRITEGTGEGFNAVMHLKNEHF